MANKISLLFVAAGFIIMSFGLYFTLKKIKPIEAVLLVGSIIAFLTFASLIAKYLQDKGSSEKSDKALATSTTTLEEVGKVFTAAVGVITNCNLKNWW